jgi:uncharacterized glyoxalase superfamily protein PhnB
MTQQNVFPTFRYEDARAAIAWLKDTLGFKELAVMEGDGGSIEHAELVIAGNVIMLGSARSETEDRFATSRCVTYVTIEDVDAHYERAVAAGAKVEMEIVDQPYGSRDYAVSDPEGNIWSFGTYRPKLDVA